jgi:chemotaxis protein MotB
MLLAVVLGLFLLGTGCAELDILREENATLKQTVKTQEQHIRDMSTELTEIRLRYEGVAGELEKNRDLLEKLRAKKIKGVKFLSTREGILIRLSNRILFASGKDTLDAQAQSTMKAIGKIITEEFAGHNLRVVGHTDKEPIRVSRQKIYPTNWELSCRRACTVARYLINNRFVTAQKVVAAGHSFYDPAEPWNGRKKVAANRRVEIIVLPKMKAAAPGASSGGAAPPQPPVTPK